MPNSFLAKLPRDEHGHVSLGRLDLGKLIARLVADKYEEVTGRKKKVAGVQLGNEARSAAPHAFDVMLGSQLGIGAYRALVERGLDAHMVSVTGQLDLVYVPFKDLVNPETLRTEVRLIQPGSDFHQLARFLETRTDRLAEWTPGRRNER
jgi:6-phosphofructokinase 1